MMQVTVSCRLQTGMVNICSMRQTCINHVLKVPEKLSHQKMLFRPTEREIVGRVMKHREILKRYTLSDDAPALELFLFPFCFVLFCYQWQL